MRRRTRRKRTTMRTKTMTRKRTLTWEEVLALEMVVATPMKEAETSSMTMLKSWKLVISKGVLVDTYEGRFTHTSNCS